MTSKEIVKAAIHFGTPERLPLDFPSLGLTDYAGAGWNQIGTGDNRLRRTVDEWGCTWGRTDVKNMGQVVGHPLDDWGKLDSFKWPDPDNQAFYEGMEKKFEKTQDKYMQTGIFMVLFEKCIPCAAFRTHWRICISSRKRSKTLPTALWNLMCALSKTSLPVSPA